MTDQSNPSNLDINEICTTGEYIGHNLNMLRSKLIYLTQDVENCLSAINHLGDELKMLEEHVNN